MKKLVLFGGIAGALYYLYGKGKSAVQAYYNIDTQIVNVKKIKIGISRTTFYVDIVARNTSSIPIAINTGGLATLKKVNIYSQNGTLLGFATPEATKLSIPAYGEQRINDIHTTINTVDFAMQIGELSNISNAKITMEIEAAGQTFTV